MLAILNSLNSHNLSIFQPILMILISKFMIHRALSDRTYLLIGLPSPLKVIYVIGQDTDDNASDLADRDLPESARGIKRTTIRF